MRRLIVVFLIGVLYSINSFALSPEIRFDILKTKLVEQLKNKEYKSSLNTMQELKGMGKRMPHSFKYFEAKALYESGQHTKAYNLLEQYINATGKQGKYYKQAVAYFIKVESTNNSLLSRFKSDQEIVKRFITEGSRQTARSRGDVYIIYKMETSVSLDDCTISMRTKTNTRSYIRGRNGEKYNDRSKSEINNDAFKLASLKSVEFKNDREYGHTVKLKGIEKSARYSYGNTSGYSQKRPIYTDHTNQSSSKKSAFIESLMNLKKVAELKGCQSTF